MIFTFELWVDMTTSRTVIVFWRYSPNENITDFELSITSLSDGDPFQRKRNKYRAKTTLPIKIEGLTPGFQYQLEYLSSGIDAMKVFRMRPNPPKVLPCLQADSEITITIEDSDLPNIFDKYLIIIEAKNSPGDFKYIEDQNKTAIFKNLPSEHEYQFYIFSRIKDFDVRSDPVNITCMTLSAEPNTNPMNMTFLIIFIILTCLFSTVGFVY